MDLFFVSPAPGKDAKGYNRLSISAIWRCYFTGILARYLYGEILRAFVLALGTITAIFVLFVVMAEAAQKGLTPHDIFNIAPLIVPSSLPYTVPVALLFAVSVIYGRIASDNEVIAIKTSGVSAMVVLWPAMFLGLTLSVLLNYLAADVIPTATHSVQKFIFGNMEEIFYKFLKKDKEINNPDWPFLIIVRDVVDGRTMVDAYFKHRAGKGPENANRFDTVIHASTATIKFDLKEMVARVHLGKDAEVYMTGPKPSVAIVNDHDFDMELPPGFSKQRIPIFQEMTFKEMDKEQRELQIQIARAEASVGGRGDVDRFGSDRQGRLGARTRFVLCVPRMAAPLDGDRYGAFDAHCPGVRQLLLRRTGRAGWHSFRQAGFLERVHHMLCTDYHNLLSFDVDGRESWQGGDRRSALRPVDRQPRSGRVGRQVCFASGLETLRLYSPGLLISVWGSRHAYPRSRTLLGFHQGLFRMLCRARRALRCDRCIYKS